MTQITNLGTLKTAIADTLNRTDLTTSIPRFISLAQVDINARFRTADMETLASLTMTAGSPLMALPTDFAEARRMQYTAATGDVRELTLAPFAPLRGNEEAQQDGWPQSFSIVGSNFFIKPTPNAAYPVSLYYYLGVPDLDYTDDTDTNWLLTGYPNVYLYGSLLSALPKIGNDVRAELWATYYNQGIQNIKDNDKSKRFARAPRMRSAVFS